MELAASIEQQPRVVWERRWLYSLLGVFLALKLACFLLAAVGLRAGIVDPQFASGTPMVSWDSLHYLEILNNGYPPASVASSSETPGFFPLLPLLAWPLAQVMAPSLAMLVVSNAASLLGILFFFAWCRRATGDAAAFWAGALLLAYPPAIFLSAAYTEPLFMATTAAALYFADRKRPVLAALLAGIGSAARPTGIVTSLVIWIDAILQTPREKRLRAAPRLIAIGFLCIGGIALHAAFLTVRYGTPLAYIHAQKNFVNQTSSPATTEVHAAVKTVDETPPRSATEKLGDKFLSVGAWGTLLAWSTLAFSIIILIPRLPWPRHILALPILIFLLGYLPDHGARINSCSRFMTAALPMFAAIPILPFIKPRRWILLPCIALFIAVDCLYAYGFSRGVWAG